MIWLLACAAPGTWTVNVEPLDTTLQTTEDDCTIELTSFSTVLANPSLGDVVPHLEAWAFDLTQDGTHTTGPVETVQGEHVDATVWNMGYGALSGTAPDSALLIEQVATTRAVGTVTCDRTVSFDLALHNDEAWTCDGPWTVGRETSPTLTVAIDGWRLWSQDLEGGPLVAQDWVDADTNLDGVLIDDELEFVALDLRDPGSSGALNVLEFIQEQPERWLSCR